MLIQDKSRLQKEKSEMIKVIAEMELRIATLEDGLTNQHIVKTNKVMEDDCPICIDALENPNILIEENQDEILPIQEYYDKLHENQVMTTEPTHQSPRSPLRNARHSIDRSRNIQGRPLFDTQLHLLETKEAELAKKKSSDVPTRYNPSLKSYYSHVWHPQ